ncbi:hypothetical protein HDU76_008962, partial [Blyttiomyces sp. JEL0837]
MFRAPTEGTCQNEHSLAAIFIPDSTTILIIDNSDPAMDNKLPTELIDIIFTNHADILSQYLNNRLSDEEIKNRATDIWVETFDQDWTGDLQRLPQHGFPTIFNGLGKVKSRSMYKRLCILRPDLAGISDELTVLIHNNPWYGVFNQHDGRPILLLDDKDKIPEKKESEK